MYIGSHGYDHYWLNTLDPDEQRREIDLSIEFLLHVGARADSWIMSYPYGAYDELMFPMLRERGCRVGLSTEVRIADLAHDHALALPRLDTNDLPKRATAAPSEWTRAVSR